MRVWSLTLLRASLLLLVALAGSGEAAAVDSFTFTGNLLMARHNAYAALLNNGKVLVAGGQYNGPTDSAELYDPATGMFTATGNMVTAVIGGRTITSLPNGKVLLAGGFIYGGGSYPPPSTAQSSTIRRLAVSPRPAI